MLLAAKGDIVTIDAFLIAFFAAIETAVVHVAIIRKNWNNFA